ncbi:uncharacterized protein LOC130921403 [Corythoichthys intestinalis]|uniref:uncharacterized protein LOC130921403 n=1 Tax=Corythoichthys intestinalis TaxID=161448 RepID=UPI0025A612BC|nr:uncharacterized protein LOC130921403 [Corythoichthys intestinalis]
MENMLLLLLLTTMAATQTSARRSGGQVNYWTTASPANNLNGKMITLSSDGFGGISFYPPNYSFLHKSNWLYPNRAPRNWYSPTIYPTATYPSGYPWTTSSYPSWTTPPTTTGVTVCLRYLLDPDSNNIFTLSPNSPDALTLTSYYDGNGYRLTWGRSYQSVRLRANVRMWSLTDNMWNRICLVVDSVKGFVQIFKGGYMSIRKGMVPKYAWSGEPIVAVSNTNGQVTDLQMWDFPLSYNGILNYVARSSYGWPTGSVLTWSNIRYSLTGRALVEDVYERQQAAKRGKNIKKMRKSKKEGAKEIVTAN